MTVVMVTTSSGNQNAGQIQQQGIAAVTGSKLSHIEMNVLKTMITIIIVFAAFWSATSLGNFFLLFGVSIYTHTTFYLYLFIYYIIFKII